MVSRQYDSIWSPCKGFLGLDSNFALFCESEKSFFNRMLIFSVRCQFVSSFGKSIGSKGKEEVEFT